jgi:hypothetical protein
LFEATAEEYSISKTCQFIKNKLSHPGPISEKAEVYA